MIGLWHLKNLPTTFQTAIKWKHEFVDLLGCYVVSRNVGNQLPINTEKRRRRAKISLVAEA